VAGYLFFSSLIKNIFKIVFIKKAKGNLFEIAFCFFNDYEKLKLPENI